MNYSRPRPYVGRERSDPLLRNTVFRSRGTPTGETHGGRFTYVTGPFRTVLAARFFAAYAGPQNPHLLSVDDAEREVKKEIARGVALGHSRSEARCKLSEIIDRWIAPQPSNQIVVRSSAINWVPKVGT